MKKIVKGVFLILIIALFILSNLNYISSQGICWCGPSSWNEFGEPEGCSYSGEECDQCYKPVCGGGGYDCGCTCVRDYNECPTPGSGGDCPGDCVVVNDIYYRYYFDSFFPEFCLSNSEVCDSNKAHICYDSIFSCNPILECVAITEFSGTSFIWEDNTAHGEEGGDKLTPDECSDGYDNDCDALTDCEDRGACSDSTICCNNGVKDIYEVGVDCEGDCGQDNDGDGYYATKNCTSAFDCRDDVFSVNSGAIEGIAAPGTCTDIYDNDCDGKMNCDDADCLSDPTCTVCVDNDGDKYNITGGTTCGIVDCNDTNANVKPGGIESSSSGITCSDGHDNDCDANSGGGIDWDDQVWASGVATGLFKSSKGDNGCAIGVEPHPFGLITPIMISAGGVQGNVTPIENDELYIASQIIDSNGVNLFNLSSIEFYVGNQLCSSIQWAGMGVIYSNCSSGEAGVKNVTSRVNTLKSFAVVGQEEGSIKIDVLARPGTPEPNPPWCVSQNIDRCNDYNVTECVRDRCEVEEASKPSSLVCGNSLCDSEDKWNNCLGCTWNGSECSYGWNKVNCTSGASSSGWCSVANEDILKPCDEEPIGEMTVEWKGTWMSGGSGDDPEDISDCVNGQQVTMACPEKGNLPFFGSFQFIISFFIIGIVYFVMRKK